MKSPLKKFWVLLISTVMIIGGAMTSLAADVGQYPLQGKLEELGLTFAPKIYYYSYDSSTGQLSDPEVTYVFEYSGSNMTSDEIIAKCKAEGTLKYYGISSDAEVMVAIALLANEQIALNPGDPGLYFDGINEERLQRGYEIADNLRQFLGTFENGWENASDYEKAVHVSKWILLADYDAYTGYGGSYACLVKKACSCGDYTAAAKLLSHLVGLQCIEAIDVAAHVYPVFYVNGVWISFEPSTTLAKSVAQKDMKFITYDLYAPLEAQTASFLDFLEENGKERVDTLDHSFENYFRDQGYVVPDDLRDYFPAEWCNQIAGAKYGDGNHSVWATLEMHDDCGHFPFNQSYSN